MTGRFDRRRPAWAEDASRPLADNVGTVDNPTSPVYVPDADKAADRLRVLMTCAAECGKGSVIWSERRIVDGKAFHEDCLPEPKCQKPVNKCQIATSDDGRERLVDVPPTLDRDEAEEAVRGRNAYFVGRRTDATLAIKGLPGSRRSGYVTQSAGG